MFGCGNFFRGYLLFLNLFLWFTSNISHEHCLKFISYNSIVLSSIVNTHVYYFQIPIWLFLFTITLLFLWINVVTLDLLFVKKKNNIINLRLETTDKSSCTRRNSQNNCYHKHSIRFYRERARHMLVPRPYL